MPKIERVRPVLLSAPYADKDNLEVQRHLPSGLRTCGLVEVTLEGGVTGVGEGYLAVFAPHVFRSAVELIAPYLLGTEASDVRARLRDMELVTGYWSLQGAARHVLSAVEIALLDASAKHLGVPVYTLLGGKRTDEITLYGSGGNAPDPEGMMKDIALLKELGIGTLKMRALKDQVRRTAFTLEAGKEQDVNVAVDMTQNLKRPAQRVSDVVTFVNEVHRRSDQRIVFLEEALGPDDLDGLGVLRQKLDVPICGGEIVTTPDELCYRVEQKRYDFVQPDATVIGGVLAVMQVFDACTRHGSSAVVHAWGSAVCLAANYHAAFAGGAELAEWPIPTYELRAVLFDEALTVREGRLKAPERPGLGVTLSPEIERAFPFREEAIYQCFPNPVRVAPESAWA